MLTPGSGIPQNQGMSDNGRLEEKEGFICPFCLVSFATVVTLSAHFLRFHEEQSASQAVLDPLNRVEEVRPPEGVGRVGQGHILSPFFCFCFNCRPKIACMHPKTGGLHHMDTSGVDMRMSSGLFLDVNEMLHRPLTLNQTCAL